MMPIDKAILLSAVGNWLASGDVGGGGDDGDAGGLGKEHKAVLCTQKPTDSKLFGDLVWLLCMLV
jgi:hypothetical protein